MDTIFAKSSGMGKSGIAIFRISGPQSLDILYKLLNTPHPKEQFLPNKFYKKKIFDPENKYLIDDAMVVFFKSPHSFTGEDIVELHTHGSIAINNIIINILSKIPNTRIAEKGEFSKRAFLNGKFDLTSAEGLADLIDAETTLQHKQAIRQYKGGLEKIYEEWRAKALKTISLLEAYIDFPEEDIPTEVSSLAKKNIEQLSLSIKKHLSDNQKGERLKNGIKVSIVGEPNVGKSSLLNFLLDRDVAIVSSIPGTTRDVIEGHLDIEGYPIILQDTAGIRDDSNDLIEIEGIKRSISMAQNADLIIWICDPMAKNELPRGIGQNYSNIIKVINKVDLLSTKQLDLLKKSPENNLISIKNKSGLNELINKISRKCQELAGISEDPTITRTRHRKNLEQVVEHLDSFLTNGSDIVLACEDIRLSIRYLSTITGKISVEEILGEIFHNFCIGK